MTSRTIKVSKRNYKDLDNLRKTEKGNVSFNSLITHIVKHYKETHGLP